ncbi:unnamed protein product [Lathyrus oleraceus]
MSKVKEVIIRQVWTYNLEYEFNLIRQAIHQHPVVSMDTEFPGVIHSPKIHCHYLQPYDNYYYLKANVDELKLIQFGLTLTDIKGNLPDFGSNNTYIWEFNFRDFDVNHDPCNQDSIQMLCRQGIDFNRNFRNGVDSMRFAELMFSSGLVFNKSVMWITFSSAYDFGYLVKILTQKNLPNRLEDFLNNVEVLFGKKVIDMKHMMKFCNFLHGGLERVATTLNVSRVVGKFHQAGSDSLLIGQTFRKLIEILIIIHKKVPDLKDYAGVLFGLEIVV